MAGRVLPRRLGSALVGVLAAFMILAAVPRPAQAIFWRVTIRLSGPGAGSVTDGAGLISCSIDNGTQSGDCQGSYPSNAVALYINDPVGTLGCSPKGCYGENSSNQENLTIPSGDSFYDVFFDNANRYLAVTKSGSGKGTVTSVDGLVTCVADCSGQDGIGYKFGDTTTLVADPAPGSTFTGWGSGCASKTTFTCTVQMTSTTATKTMNAAFALMSTPKPSAKPASSPSATVPIATPAATLPAASDGATPPAPGDSTGGQSSAGPPTPGSGSTDQPSGGVQTSAPSTSAPGTTTASEGLSGSLGWIAFFGLLVLVIGVGIGAFFARRRGPAA